MTHTKQAEVDSHNKDRADAVLHEDDVNKHDQEDDDEELRDQEHANAVLHLDDMDEHVHEEADVSRRDQEHADADLHEDALAVHRPDQDEASLHDQDHDDSDSHDPEQVATLYDQDQSDPILHNQEQDEADFKEDDVTLCDAAVATWMKDTNQSNAVRNDEGQDVDAHETDADLRVAESYHGYEPNHEDCIDERFVNHHRGCYGVISDSEAESLCRSDLRDIESGCVVRMYQYGRPSELCRIRSGCIDRINRGGQFDRDTVRVFCLQSIGLLGYEEIKFISSLETCWPLGSGVVILPILYQSYWYLIATVHEDSENATMYIFNNVTKDFSGSTIDDVKKMIEDAGMHVSIKYAKIKTFGGPALQKQIDDSGLFVVNAVQSIVEIIGFDTDKKICEKIDAQQFKISRSRQQLSKEIEELVANKVLRCDIFWAFYECKEKAGVFVWPCYKLSKSFAHKMDDDHKSNDVAVVWFKRTKGYSLCDWLSNNSLASITALSLDEVIANYYGGDAVDGLIDAYNSAQSNIGA